MAVERCRKPVSLLPPNDPLKLCSPDLRSLGLSDGMCKSCIRAGKGKFCVAFGLFCFKFAVTGLFCCKKAFRNSIFPFQHKQNIMVFATSGSCRFTLLPVYMETRHKDMYCLASPIPFTMPLNGFTRLGSSLAGCVNPTEQNRTWLNKPQWASYRPGGS